MSFLTATAQTSQQGNVCLLKLNLFPRLTGEGERELLALNVLYTILANIYWLVETHYGQCSSTVCCRCLQIYKHFVTLLSQWLRRGENYSKPHWCIRYKQVFLALKLAWEIQYYLCLYISQGLFNVGQTCYMFKKKTQTKHDFVIKLLLIIYVLEHYSTANFLNDKSTNRSLIFLEFILTELHECLKQTKNNAPAKKAFLRLERDCGPCSHYRASFCKVQQRCTMNAQTQEPHKCHHLEHRTDPPGSHQEKKCISAHWNRPIVLSVKYILNRHKS